MRTLFAPVSIASLVAFRIAFGALMMVAVARYFAHDWIAQFYVAPRLFFPYPGLEWIVPMPAPAMYGLFAALGVAALCVTVGLYYRAAITVFCLGFTYAHLIDRANYLNHYYLVSLLSALMVILPLHRAGSLDAWRRPALRAASAPAWAVWLLRFQLGVVYVFGAVAKLNPDWLSHAQPLRIWLGANVDLPLLGAWLEQPWAAYACSYAGLLFDATIVPLLVWRRTRTIAYAAVLAFHLLTALLFPIGMFPWLMIGLTPIFFAPDWPISVRRVLTAFRVVAGLVPAPADRVRERRSPPAGAALRSASAARGRGGHEGRRYAERLAPAVLLTLRRRLGVALLAIHAAVQIALPLRHLLYAGDLYWSEAGFRFAWQIMVMEKYGRGSLRAIDSDTGETWVVRPTDYLTPLQARMMITQPDMIRSFASYVAADLRARGHGRVELHADVLASLNGRPHRRLVDPRVDLARESPGAALTDWILPLEPAKEEHS